MEARNNAKGMDNDDNLSNTQENDETDCQNYRGIALLSVIYKVFAKILAKWLSPYTEQIIGDYHRGFRRDGSNTDQIFALRIILGKYAYNIVLHQLFIYFKQAYVSINREKLTLILGQFKVPRKLINLIGMSLRNTTGRV